MKKRTIFTYAFLVMLAFTITSCRLPSSGSPPPISTSIQVPTSTSGIVVVPTSTALPPTPVVVTSTSVPPTPIPPTTVPPSPTPPVATSLPPAIRIQFAAGAASAEIDGDLQAGQTIYYVLRASATQTMSVKVNSPNADVYLGVSGADGQVYLTSSSQDIAWQGRLPKTQDYYISLAASGGKTSYTLTVEIPPLVTGPTPNVTPVAGAFNPVTTYGNPTFDDPMNGDNINDWVNPSTGLLPDTKYLKITETNQQFFVTGKLTGFNTWYFTWHELTDFYLQSTFNSGNCSGKDAYGLIIRGPQHLAGESFGYVVAFSCDGQYWIFRLDSASPYTAVDLVSWTHSDNILAGANKENVMGIKAIGNKLTIYANGHQIAEVTDNNYDTGRYGVFVSPDLTANYTYQVVHMSYWDLTP